MSHTGQENPGTGLRDVLDILVKTPSERLLSLTFQLSESPEDKIIQALCLIILQREAQALEQLQTLRENHLANHLAEKWQLSGGKLEDFSVHCGDSQGLTGESWAALARIFKVLSEQRLCDTLLRNLAYKRAVSSDYKKTISNGDLEYFQLREEAKEVCGPELAEWICSSTGPKSNSYRDPLRIQSEAITALKVSLSQDQSARGQNLPSPLQASCSMPSYPTHLEISIPPTASFQNDKRAPETSEESKINSRDLLVSEFEAESMPQIPGQSNTWKSIDHPEFDEKLNSTVEKSDAESKKLDILINPISNKTTKPITEPKSDLPVSTNIYQPKMTAANDIQRSDSTDEEEEETFYAFVILHAPEDADIAESMRQKLEKVIGSDGAIFCDDFDVPGKSTLRCVEDAINNSAFTLLLLTRNFNTPMKEVEADSALINSINKKHKYNTVIPVLPQENFMPKKDMPLVLATKTTLEENKNFEKRVKKAMTPAVIKRQRKMWTEEQTLKMQKKKQERLQKSNKHQKQMLEESKALELLEKEKLDLLLAQKRLLNPGLPPEQEDRALLQQQPNIHINNAKFIMIGNDSRMTVMPGDADKDDSIYTEEDKE
ncbi:TIR domain-containing adapter molecule 1 [Tautogolabrus adspersus]